jgi:hypothetical protein
MRYGKGNGDKSEQLVESDEQLEDELVVAAQWRLCGYVLDHKLVQSFENKIADGKSAEKPLSPSLKIR